MDNFSNSQDYDVLLKEGIDFIQKYSGDKWSDYNYHDPGITILEQLCFAITDLGFKSNFPIEDILMMDMDDFDFEKNNLFIPPEKIFHSNANTINDIRKLIIDSIEEINNVWVFRLKENSYANFGLLDFKVQLSENVNQESNDLIENKIRTIYNDNRILGSDINEVKILNKDIISISAQIQIDSFCVGEEILAKIFVEVESRLNKRVKSVGYEYFEDEDLTYDNIFQGVKTENGLILDENLTKKTNEIYVSEIIEIIRNINGVISVKDFGIYKNGIKLFSEIISFSENSFPSFEDINTFFSKDSDSDINFIRNNTHYLIDKIIFEQLHDSISNQNSISLINKFKNENLKKGRFNYDEISKYYPIINEFPSLYGLKEKELNPNSSRLRKAQMKHLKAYLCLFDQIMANYNSQIVNIRNIFSLENKDKTYFTKIPENISNINELFDKDDLEKYKTQLNYISETDKQFFERKNLFLDHLISRFGETYNSKILENIYSSENQGASFRESSDYALQCKIRYAKNIYELGLNRNKGRNYTVLDSANKNISGIERRMQLILDLKDNFADTDLGFDKLDVEFREKEVWSNLNLKIKNGPNLDVLSLPDYCYENKQVNFYLKKYSNFLDLFKNAINKKSFKILNDGTMYHLLYHSPLTKIPIKIFHSKSRSLCLKNISKIISKLNSLNTTTERFFVVENILLRPLVVDKFKMKVLSNQVVLFNSFKIYDFNTLTEIREDLLSILGDRSNYSIHKSSNNSKRFSISVFDVMDNKILTSSKQFNNRVDAQNEMENILNNLLKNSKIDIEIYSENKSLNKFPENFNYSNEINIVIPDWPTRFQNVEFRKHIKDSIDFYLPANIKFNLHFLDFSQINFFTEIYSEWKKMKLNKVSTKLDLASLKIIQFLIKVNDG